MPQNIVYIILWVLIWIIIWYLVARIYFWIKLSGHRKDAIDRSKSVILWAVNEKIAPILPNFSYNFNDLVFIGKWIDYIVFDGLSDWNLRQVVFLEIKTWKSNLNKNEKQIKLTIEKWEIKYEIMKL